MSILDNIDGKACDLLGENTKFRATVERLVSSLVDKGRWFGFSTRVSDEQIDIFSAEGKNGKLGNLLVDELGDYDGYRNTLYRYLLNNYLCYCEIPSVVRQRDYSGFKDSYNKSLVTANIEVIANWLGVSIDDADAKYGSRVSYQDYDRDDGMSVYVKLSVAKDGTRKIVRPKKDLDLTTKGIRIIPLFAIKRGIDILYQKASSDFYNVTFVKDSGQQREITVCFDYGKLCEVYRDKGMLTEQYEEQFKGDFLNIKTLERGYIRVIEVGTNLRNHALRSINVARIIKFEKVEPDLTFVDIDLDTVKSTFLSKIENYDRLNYKELTDMLELMGIGSTVKYGGKAITSYAMLESWVEQQEILLSTPFIKQLALFMMANPKWFGKYPSTDNTGTVGETSIELSGNDLFDDELDFDI